MKEITIFNQIGLPEQLRWLPDDPGEPGIILIDPRGLSEPDKQRIAKVIDELEQIQVQAVDRLKPNECVQIYSKTNPLLETIMRELNKVTTDPQIQQDIIDLATPAPKGNIRDSFTWLEKLGDKKVKKGVDKNV